MNTFMYIYIIKLYCFFNLFFFARGGRGVTVTRLHVNHHLLNQRQIQHWCTPFWNFSRVYFWKFWQHNMRKIYCNQHAMFTMCILFSTLTKKHRVCVKGHQNNLRTTKSARTARPSSKIPGSAIAYKCTFSDKNWLLVNDMAWIA